MPLHLERIEWMPSPPLAPGDGPIDFDHLQRMALGDAVNAVQIGQFVAHAECLLTWNAKHYQGKLAIPALTPEEWWQQNQPAA